MTADRLMILRHLQNADGPEIDRRVLDLLEQDKTQTIGCAGRGGTVLGTMGIWKTRAKTNDQAGHPLIGAEDLLRELDKRAHNSRVEQLSFVGTEYTCNLFFEWTSRKFVGFVLAKRRTKSEERTELARLSATSGLKQAQLTNSNGRKARQMA